MRRAVRTSDFWFLAGTFFVCGATSNGLVGQHFIPHAVDHGFTAVAASGALAVMGVFNFVGTIASGWLTDRYDPRKLLLVYYTFRGVSLLFLPFIHDTMTIAAFAILFGLDYIATVPPTVALVADRFGRRNVGVVYGWVFAAHMFGAAIAAWVAGVVRESVGDYAPAFVAAGWIAIVAGFAALGIQRRRARRGRVGAGQRAGVALGWASGPRPATGASGRHSRRMMLRRSSRRRRLGRLVGPNRSGSNIASRGGVTPWRSAPPATRPGRAPAASRGRSSRSPATSRRAGGSARRAAGGPG